MSKVMNSPDWRFVHFQTHFLCKYCILSDSDFTSTGISIIIYPKSHEVLTLQRSKGIQWFDPTGVSRGGTSHKGYSMKQVPIFGGAQTVEEKNQVNALLTRFKKKPMQKVVNGLQKYYEVTNKATTPMKKTTPGNRMSTRLRSCQVRKSPIN